MSGNARFKGLEPEAWTRGSQGTEDLVTRYVRVWENRKIAPVADTSMPDEMSELPPCITISRKIGVGALAIADRVAEKLEFAVADRELIEQIASQTNISEKAVAFFDERFPGYANRTFKYLFGEKAFIDSDYSRHLVRAVLALAASQPTVFVGRGAHLILPRDHVLAVRCICSDDHRVRLMADMLNLDKAEAAKKLTGIDKEQAAFFKKVYGKREAAAYEFDMVINLDTFTDPVDVAEIVISAFTLKFKAVD